MADVIPPEPHRPWFQGTAGANADDFALAVSSLRETLPVVAEACGTIGRVIGMELDYPKCHWVQFGNMPCNLLQNSVETCSCVPADAGSTLAQIIWVS